MLPPGFEPPDPDVPGLEPGFAVPGFDPGFAVSGFVDPPFGELGFDPGLFPGVPFGPVLGFGLSGLFGEVDGCEGLPGVLGVPGAVPEFPLPAPVGGAAVPPVGGVPARPVGGAPGVP